MYVLCRCVCAYVYVYARLRIKQSLVIYFCAANFLSSKKQEIVYFAVR